MLAENLPFIMFVGIIAVAGLRMWMVRSESEREERELAEAEAGLPPSEILSRHIQRYVERGFHVTYRTETPPTAQLIRPKRFSFFWALAWFLLFGVGILVYVIYFAAKSDERVYLAVDSSSGSVKAL